MSLARIAAIACLASAAACASPTQVAPETRTEMAREAFVDGDMEDAALEAKLALQGNPLDAHAHFVLANSLASQGQLDQAVVGYRRVWALDPTHPLAAYNIGTALLLREEPVPAATWFETALASHPDHVPSYNNLGKAYFLSGLPELAVASYEEALSRDTTNRVALTNLASLYDAVGSSDVAASYRLRLHALGDGAEQAGRGIADPKIASGAEEQPSRSRPTADKASPKVAPPPADVGLAPEVDPGAPPPPAVNLDNLRALLSDLPHVQVHTRAGRVTLSGWTRNELERSLLDRVLKENPQVLDLTTTDTGDSQRMIEVDATLFYVVATEGETYGFNFLKMVNVTFDVFASHNLDGGFGLAGPGGRFSTNDSLLREGSNSGWLSTASVDYDVTIANAVDDRVAILARPHLTTLSGTAATFLAGGEVVFRVSGNISGDIKPYPFGTHLEVTPTLLRTPAADGGPRVHMKVEAGRKSILDLLIQKDSDLENAIVFDNVVVTGEAVLDTDQTLIMSGLSQKERRTGASGVPVLRDIPVLKWFFSSRSEVEVETSVIILLTPRDPGFVGEENRAAINAFVEKRRAFIKARNGTEEDFRRFEERYPDWRQLPPNRFASHFFLMAKSDAYRKISGYDLVEEDLALQILDSSWK